MPPREYYLPERRLVSQQDAALIERANIPRSKFINTWTRKTAFDAKYLTPIMVDEILPGDHMTYNVTAYVRMSTPVFPIFDNQRIETFFFFVPSRILWRSWTKMMGEQLQPGDSIAFTMPQIVLVAADIVLGGIYDHMGIPGINQITNNISVNALPLRAYARIFNEWFRDQNINPGFLVLTDEGPDPANTYELSVRAKAHDRFTSALPWAQKFTAPNVPLAGQAPVKGIGWDPAGTTTTPGGQDLYESGDTFGVSALTDYAHGHRFDNAAALMWVEANATGVPQIYADLTQATGVAINTLRQAWMIQSLLERDARGGTRYTEVIQAHFGIKNPDSRVQRPEYIGGGKTPLNITPVAQTAPADDTSVGDLGGAGTAAGSHHASYAATEHGYIIGLINVRSELSYQQGINKLWMRLSRYDFYWPALAQLGEQAILRQELYMTGVAADDETVFGYAPAWDEYRQRTSEVTGIMRSTAVATLDRWHLAQKFLTPPTLSTAFIQEDPPMARVLAAADQAANQQYLADIMFNRTAVRQLPTFGTPAILGRF